MTFTTQASPIDEGDAASDMSSSSSPAPQPPAAAQPPSCPSPHPTQRQQQLTSPPRPGRALRPGSAISGSPRTPQRQLPSPELTTPGVSPILPAPRSRHISAASLIHSPHLELSACGSAPPSSSRACVPPLALALAQAGTGRRLEQEFDAAEPSSAGAESPAERRRHPVHSIPTHIRGGGFDSVSPPRDRAGGSGAGGGDARRTSAVPQAPSSSRSASPSPRQVPAMSLAGLPVIPQQDLAGSPSPPTPPPPPLGPTDIAMAAVKAAERSQQQASFAGVTQRLGLSHPAEARHSDSGAEQTER